MKMTEELRASLEELNPKQREAVEAIDGPLLVVAGPGTGKTQILSLRAANILAKRDVAPDGILCLTFTDAGAEAMRKRLVSLIGREGYDIEVATFHSFASSLRSRFPECFGRTESAKVISDIRKKLILSDILKGLDVKDPMWSALNQGKPAKLGDALGFVDFFQRSGLTTDEFRRIQQQTRDSLAYMTDHSELLDLANAPLPRAQDKKETAIAAFEAEVERAVSMAPKELIEPVVSTTGIYVPYLLWLRDVVRATELIDEGGKSEGYQKLRDKLMKGTAAEGKSFKDADACDRACSLANIYDAYRRVLVEHDLYDFQDMITEAIEALVENPDLRHELQAQYRYIQVDEFQDTNGSQMRLVELLTEGLPKPNIMVVGDDDQAIMRFQGASVACIEQFIERYHPAKVVLLTNYRSTPAVVDLGKRIAEQIETRLGDSRTEKDLQANQKTSEQVGFTYRVYPSKDVEYYAMAEDIRRRIDEGFIRDCEKPEEAIAVIAAKHDSLRKLLPYLRHFNIPFSYKHTSNALEMETLQPLLAIMRFAAAYAQGSRALAESYLPQIVAAPELGLSSVTIVQLALDARQKHSWMQALRESGNERLTELHDSLVEWSAKAAAAPVRELIYEMAQKGLGYYRALRDENPLAAAEFNGGIRALIGFVEAEIMNSRPFDAAMRLPEVIAMLNGLGMFDITIDATIEVGRPDAVRLTTAHSSKGLEFDLVYLLDGDDQTWHKGGSHGNYLTKNLLTGTERDDADDVRRLLFVAITRAKRRLEIFGSDPVVVRELQELVNERAEEIGPEELDAIIEASWLERFALDTPELKSLLRAQPPRGLSATALNAFVRYEDGCPNSASFPVSRLLKLPSAPSINMEFGTQVHAFLQDYLAKKGQVGFSLDDLAARHRQEILWLDFDETDLEGYARRFDRIVKSFVPFLNDYAYGRMLSEYELKTLLDEVPLYGKADLILIDDESKTIEVVDFKTGMGHDSDEGSSDYERQLRFYKLLIESRPEFKGYQVIKCSDVFVEPERDTGDIHEPVVSEVADIDQDHLKQLIKAVWQRIIACDFDTSGFEESPEFQEAMAQNVTKSGAPRKNKDRRLFQEAYERWLINN